LSGRSSLPHASGSYSREAILVDAVQRQKRTIQELVEGLQAPRCEEDSEEDDEKETDSHRKKKKNKSMKLDYSKFEKRWKGEGNSKPHCDPAEAMNKAFKTFHSKRDIDNQCLACWLIIKLEFFPAALDWGLEESGLILPKI
jgi:hypothetical protein